jgi:AAA+ ATPase superfamily predicted ATPase
MADIVGRSAEKEVLQRTLDSREAEFVAIYGRRRVGKTYLIRAFYENHMRFELTGEYKASLADQLENFAFALGRAQNRNIEAPESWRKAFQLLISFIDTLDKKQKHVLFFDELPWLCSPRSQFLSNLEYFWNAWCVKYPNIILVVCGSAASWMIQKIINNKGGLHNRTTRRIQLAPFSLTESHSYLKYRGINLSHRQVLQLYMSMGGIPYYLKEVERGLSAAQNIANTCFSKTGLLKNEFLNLFASLFKHSHRHEQIVRILAANRMGLSRQDIQDKSKQKSGGTLTTTLSELVESGFIEKLAPGKGPRKVALYRLVDEYTLFYLHWIENSTISNEEEWLKRQNSPAWLSWSGYAFETICLKHVDRLKQALGIGSVESDIYSWLHRSPSPENPGAQIDLVIDRRDDCINLCEMKFSLNPFVVDKKYASTLQQKKEVFRNTTGTRKSLFTTLITVEGVRVNEYLGEVVDQSIDADVLFS